MKTPSPKVSNQKKTGIYDLPVSRKFYISLLERVEEILRAIYIDPDPLYSRQARRLIDNYLHDNLDCIPDHEILPEIRIIFLTLKAEIDRARQRSRRARQAARLRANRRPTAPQTASTAESTTPVTPIKTVKSRNRRTGLKWKPAHHFRPIRQVRQVRPV